MKLGHPANKDEFVEHLTKFNGFKQISENNLIFENALDVMVVSINDKFIYISIEAAPGASSSKSWSSYKKMILPKNERVWTKALQTTLNLF